MKAELKRKLIATLIIPAIGASIAGVAVAAGEKDTMGRGSAMREEMGTQASAQDIRASKLIGMKVKNAQDETLGKIDDLVVDVNNDRVYYAVLASGGVMGLGGKHFAYPVSLFRPGADKDELLLNVDKERLKKAPGFDSKNAPAWGTGDRYRAEVDRYFGPTVTAKAMPNEHLVLASKLIGKDIDDREGKNAGEIKDLVVNLGTSRIRYAVMDFDKGWMKEDKLLPMPLQAFTFPPERDRNKDLVLNLAKNQLDMAKGIDKSRWNDLDINDPNYKRDVDSYMRTASSGLPGNRGAAGPSGARERTETKERSDQSSGYRKE